MKRAAEIMNQLTPDKMVTLCGSPLRENYAKGIDTLSMWYTGTDGHKVDVSFLCNRGTCMFFSMLQGRFLNDSHDPADYDDPFEKGMTSEELHHLRLNQVKELPCLAGLPEQ